MSWPDPEFYFSYFSAEIYPRLHYVFGNAGVEALLLLIVIIAAVAYRNGRRAERVLSQFNDAHEALWDRCEALDQARGALERKNRVLDGQLEQLMIRQCELETPSGKAEVKHAIALARLGANTRQLVECGLSYNEAELIRTLYGAKSAA